jgi:hypothetical protein
VSKENGFVPLRRGIWEHVRDGRMSKLEALAFIYICSQADTRTGIWKGSAGALAGELGLPERTARDVLEKMEHGDYVRRFAVPGQHLCYPILVHKFPISQGEHNGEQLDALSSSKSDGCLEVRYFSREHGVEQHGEHGVEHGAAQRIQETRDRIKDTPSARDEQPNTLEQETIEAGFEVFWECWPLKQAKSAARRAWGKIPLAEYAAISSGLAHWKTSDQWKRGIIPHAATWLNGKRWTDEIPQFVGGSNGTGTRKQTATDLALQNAKALGLGQPN